jgi:hypothetical protein
MLHVQFWSSNRVVGSLKPRAAFHDDPSGTRRSKYSGACWTWTFRVSSYWYGIVSKDIRFKTRFSLADIPLWSSRYSYEGSDTRFISQVRPAVQKRGYLTAPEFYDICYWKTPRTQSRCHQNSAEEIRVLTKAALATEDESLKMELLRALDGVDWATASTLLHFCDERPYPILDYRALWSLGYSRPPHYTMPFWLSYVAHVRKLAQRTGHPIRAVDRALWQYSKEHQRPSIRNTRSC